MRGDLDKLVAFVKNEFPVDAGEISDAIELLSLALDGLLEHTSIALTQSQHDRNFAKSKELVSLSEEVSDFQSEIIKWSNGLQDEVAVAEEDDRNDADDDEDSAPHEGNPIPNYAEYRVDQSVPHTLYESFTHKKACAFTFCGRKYPARDWKDLLIQVCDLLSDIDPNKIAQHDKGLGASDRGFLTIVCKTLTNRSQTCYPRFPEVSTIMKSWDDIRRDATQFAKTWRLAYDEKSQAQSFLLKFFEVFGVETNRVATFEHRIKHLAGI